MNDREKLRKELFEHIQVNPNRKSFDENLIDFILARDKKIVEPLVNIINDKREFISWKKSTEVCHKAIHETLKNAGITE